MYHNKYIVLKSKGSVIAPSETSFLKGRGVVFDFDIETGDQTEDLKTDPNVIATIPAIPMKLIQCMPQKVTNSVGTTDDDISWGVKAVGADTSPFTGQGVVVAVLDSGIQKDHPAFAGVKFVTKNFTDEGNSDDVTDFMGHGTNSAGTIFGRDVKEKRIGIARGVEKVLIAKVFQKDGRSSSEWVVKAIKWAFDEGANIISMSLGFDFPRFVADLETKRPKDEAISLALEAYRVNVQFFERMTALIKQQAENDQNAVIVVAAAGNESKRDQEPSLDIAVGPPGVIEDIISVASLEQGEKGLKIANYSNTNADIAAPGENILTASIEPEDDLLGLRGGTSMAAPHVAGIAALWAEKLKKNRRLKTSTLTARVLGTVTDQGLEEGFDPSSLGAGLVRAPQE